MENETFLIIVSQQKNSCTEVRTRVNAHESALQRNFSGFCQNQ